MPSGFEEQQGGLCVESRREQEGDPEVPFRGVGEAAGAEHVPPWSHWEDFVSGTRRWVPFQGLSRHAPN